PAVESIIDAVPAATTAIHDAVAFSFPAKKPRAPRNNVKAIDFVTTNWNTTESLAKSMGCTKLVAYGKLYALMKKHRLIELSDGMWRIKPKPVEKKIAPVVAAK